MTFPSQIDAPAEPTRPVARQVGAWWIVASCAAILAFFILALPRLPAVISHALLPPGVANAALRDVVSDTAEPSSRIFFPDPDNYTRAYRAKKIADGNIKTWRRMEALNAPNGVDHHWTAPMDYLAAGAGLLGRAMGKDGHRFEIGLTLLPVALGVCYIAALIVFIRRIAGWPVVFLCAWLAAVSPSLHRVFELGHVDHHALLELLVLLSMIGLAPRLCITGRSTSPREARTCTGESLPRAVAGLMPLAAGACMGLAIWTAAQAAIFWSAICAVLLIHAARESVDGRAATFTVARRWIGGSAMVVAAAHWIENGFSLSYMALDRVSIVHVLLMLGAIIALGIIHQHAKRRSQPSSAQAGRRAAWYGGLAACIALIVFGATRASSALSGEELARWHAHVAELQPLFTTLPGDSALNGWPVLSLEPLHRRLGYFPYLLPIALPFFLIARSVPGTIRAALALTAIFIAAASIFQLRWIDHYPTFVLPVVVIGLYEALQRIASRADGLPRNRAAVPFVAALIILSSATIPFSTYARAALVHRANAASNADPISLNPETGAMLRALGPREDQIRTDFVARAIRVHEQSEPSPASRRNILCEEGEGPALLYETGLPVVAAPYHRAIDGITAMMRFFASRDPAEARAELDRLGVRYIVVPYHANEQLMNFERIAYGELRSFDEPREWIDDAGRPRRELRYRPDVTQTMAYQLAIRPLDHGIPGVELLYGIRDDPRRPDAMNGLLFIVHDINP